MTSSSAAQHLTVSGTCGLAGAVLFCVAPIPRWLVPGSSIQQMLLREAIYWSMAVAVLLWLTSVERLPLASIGFRTPTWKSAVFGIAAACAVTLLMILQFAVVIPALHLSSSPALAERQAIMQTPYWYRVLLVLRAAVFEEILYRGYLIEKVRQLSGSTGLALAISVAAFTSAHLHAWGAGSDRPHG